MASASGESGELLGASGELFAAAGVFGTPVTEETLLATGLYPEPISQTDVADYAMQLMSAGGKDTNAQKFVDNLKDRFGNGISTKCLIYNATGTTLDLVTYKDWQGHIYESPYPTVIQNGQWGAFLHVKKSIVAKGSIGAVVYRTRKPSSNSSSCDWLFCWRIPFTGPNSVYTEIREEGHFPQYWDYIYNEKLEKGDRYSDDSMYGYRSKTEIGNDTTSNARATFMLPK